MFSALRQRFSANPVQGHHLLQQFEGEHGLLLAMGLEPLGGIHWAHTDQGKVECVHGCSAWHILAWLKQDQKVRPDQSVILSGRDLREFPEGECLARLARREDRNVELGIYNRREADRQRFIIRDTEAVMLWSIHQDVTVHNRRPEVLNPPSGDRLMDHFERRSYEAENGRILALFSRDGGKTGCQVLVETGAGKVKTRWSTPENFRRLSQAMRNTVGTTTLSPALLTDLSAAGGPVPGQALRHICAAVTELKDPVGTILVCDPFTVSLLRTVGLDAKLEQRMAPARPTAARQAQAAQPGADQRIQPSC